MVVFERLKKLRATGCQSSISTYSRALIIKLLRTREVLKQEQSKTSYV